MCDLRVNSGVPTKLRHHIISEALPDGTVRQGWTTSTDDAQTWTTLFDGIYRKTVGR